ncbi:MAG: hypothetical protein ACRECE_06105 [Xanthobacteraceae bacterium]
MPRYDGGADRRRQKASAYVPFAGRSSSDQLLGVSQYLRPEEAPRFRFFCDFGFALAFNLAFIEVRDRYSAAGWALASRASCAFCAAKSLAFTACS